MECLGVAQRNEVAFFLQRHDAGYRWALCRDRDELRRACSRSGRSLMSHRGWRAAFACIWSIVQRLAFALYVSNEHACCMQPVERYAIRTRHCCDLHDHASLSKAVAAEMTCFCSSRSLSTNLFETYACALYE